MKSKALITLLLSISILSGCATTPQAPVLLKQAFWKDSNNNVGVIMTKVPELDVYLPGADCLLCIAVAEANHTTLSKHMTTLQAEGVAQLKYNLVQILAKKNIRAIALEKDLDIEQLPKFDSKNPNAAKYDFKQFREGLNLTHLLVIDIQKLGIYRPYSSYIPAGDPRGYFSAVGYLVNLESNTYEWYKPVDVFKGVTDIWDEPPEFPALTNSYYQALEEGKARVVSTFSR